MRYYRNITWTEVYNMFVNSTILPKYCIASEDSTIPQGGWSYWFKDKIHIDGTAAIVSAEFEPTMEGIMSIRWEENDWDGYPVFYKGTLPEFVADFPVKAEVEAVSNYHFLPYKPLRSYGTPEDAPYTKQELDSIRRNAPDHARALENLRTSVFSTLTEEEWKGFSEWVKEQKSLKMFSDFGDVRDFCQKELDEE